MDVEGARWLVSRAARELLAAAEAESAPGSLAAAERLRARTTPERAAGVLNQVTLRRRARAKVGDRAARLFWTSDGLEQATRAPVAARRARRFADDLAAGAVVADLGCGLGVDALALLEVGLEVLPVEADPVTAILAGANLGREVVLGDAVTAWPRLRGRSEAVFCDPARRTATGRSWRVADLSPPWDFVVGLLDGTRPACVKLGPGVPHSLLPDGVEAEWVSDAGTVVECALWAGGDAVPGLRRAVVDGRAFVGAPTPPVTGPLGEWVFEPDGAIIRAGLTDAAAARLGAHRLDPQVAYLTGPGPVDSPWVTSFRVCEVLPWDEKVLRGWVRAHGVGILEIKKRGVDLDPAVLRRRLRPSGKSAATLLCTPTSEGVRVLVVARAVRTPRRTGERVVPTSGSVVPPGRRSPLS